MNLIFFVKINYGIKCHLEVRKEFRQTRNVQVSRRFWKDKTRQDDAMYGIPAAQDVNDTGGTLAMYIAFKWGNCHESNGRP